MRKNNIPSFIQKTWEILQDPTNSSILSWSDNGCSFAILDRHRLCTEILPHYFKHSNFSSFVRQLNMYNFHKMRNNQQKLQFFHKLFRKDQKQLLIGIRRKPSQAQIMYGDQLIAKIIYQNKQNKPKEQNQNIQNKLKDIKYQQQYQQQSNTKKFVLENNFETNNTQITLKQTNYSLFNHILGSNGYKLITNIIIKQPSWTLN